MSKFKRGQSGNPKGRPKGAKNKISKDLRELIDVFLNENFEYVKNQFRELSPRDQIKFFTDLLPYAIPKLQHTKQENELSNLSPEDVEKLANELIKKIK